MSKLNNSDQLDKDLKEFTKRLPLLKMNEINAIFYEMLPLCGVGPAIAFSRFLTLNKKVVYGDHALTSAYRRNHKSLWGDELEDSIWVRCMHFENAIEAYNQVNDYIYIILYFNYELFKKLDCVEINTKDDIISLSKNIRGSKLNEIETWLHSNELTKEFADEFKDYRLFTKEMRELANDIKHRGCIAVEGITLHRNTKVTKKINGKNVDITELVSEVKIDLDVEVEKLVEIHNYTIEILKSLYKLCNFQKQLKDFLNKHI